MSPSDTERGDLAAELTNLSGYRSDNICLSERVGASPDEWHPDSRESDPNKGLKKLCHRLFMRINFYTSCDITSFLPFVYVLCGVFNAR